MSQEFPNHGKVHAIAYEGACKMVPDSVKPEGVRQSRRFSNPYPWAFEIRSWLSILARKNMGRFHRKFSQNIERRVTNGYRRGLAAFWIFQNQHSPVELNVAPFKLHYLATAQPGEQCQFYESRRFPAGPSL